MSKRVCSKCLIEKELTEFHRHKKMKQGRCTVCKVCRSEQEKLRYQENSDEIREKVSLYREKNKDKTSAAMKSYYDRNKDAIISQAKIYYAENRDKILEGKKKYYMANSDKKAEYNRQYRLENKEEINKTKRKYYRKAIVTDYNYRIKMMLRTRMYNALRGSAKAASTIDLLGCSIDYFMEYIKEQFKPGMTWENHGEWHLDHIKPCALFDFSEPAQQKECFHYTNMQPLWAVDNIIKGAKYEEAEV